MIKWPAIKRLYLSLQRVISIRRFGFPALVIYGISVNPINGDRGIPCLWRLVFGMDCPCCGLSRADALLFRGHFLDAVRMNWLIIPVVLVFFYYFTETVVNQYHMRRKSWLN
ncbi:DUF2752 domain-containing protein [bacterium]|nr:DUF2752 domain-containing protein [bacterium]